MSTIFSSNTFENDYVLACLGHMADDLKTDKPEAETLDKYAVELTAFMNGQIRQAVKNATDNQQTQPPQDAAATGH